MQNVDPYEDAYLFYRWSDDGGTNYSTFYKGNISNSVTFRIPTSSSSYLANNTNITVQWGYVRDFKNIRRTSSHKNNNKRWNAYIKARSTTRQQHTFDYLIM